MPPQQIARPRLFATIAHRRRHLRSSRASPTLQVRAQLRADAVLARCFGAAVVCLLFEHFVIFLGRFLHSVIAALFVCAAVSAPRSFNELWARLFRSFALIVIFEFVPLSQG